MTKPSLTAQWIAGHPDDEPCPRPWNGLRAQAWRKKRGIGGSAAWARVKAERRKQELNNSGWPDEIRASIRTNVPMAEIVAADIKRLEEELAEKKRFLADLLAGRVPSEPS
jgi:hypothetical protein